MNGFPPALKSLLDLGLGLARRTASGRVGMARYAPLVEDEAVPAAVREPLRAELDAAWDSVVEPFGKQDPIAVTPTAQVHIDEVDGEPVAVKLARPGVAAQIRSELALLDAIAAPLRSIFPALDVAGVMREVREATMDELDLEHEGEQQQRVRRVLRRVDGVVVPEVFLDECKPDRLVTALLEGSTEPEDAERAAELLIAAHLTAWREGGLVLTDARPSHLIFLPGGGLGLLGTGLARPHDRDRLDGFLAAFVALTDEDPAAFVAATEGLALLDADAATAAHGLLREILGPFVEGAALLDAVAMHDVTIRAYERLGEALGLASVVTPDPRDIHAARMLGQLTATLARLRVTADWPALAARL